MRIQISKWSLLVPSVVIVSMAMGLVNPDFDIWLHISEFIVIVLSLIIMNYYFIKIFKKVQKDTANII